MKRLQVLQTTTALLCCTLSLPACDTTDNAGDDPSSVANRGGPDSLVDFEWVSEPQTVNGITLVLGFTFDEDDVTVRGTCDDLVTAVVSSPVRYSYAVDVVAGGRDEVAEGDATCWVEVASGAFDFEIDEGKLLARVGDETVVFDAKGSVRGLYGDWTAESEVGTLTWSMGDGMIRATTQCANGLSASVAVDAEFTNHLEILESAEASEQANGRECSVSVQAAQAVYRFRGDALELEMGGETVRLEPH